MRGWGGWVSHSAFRMKLGCIHGCRVIGLAFFSWRPISVEARVLVLFAIPVAGQKKQMANCCESMNDSSLLGTDQ